MKKILLTLILVLSSTAFAGHEVGNGGGVLYCYPPNVAPPALLPSPKVELLDLFEAREFRKLTLGLGDVSEDYNIKIDRVLTQLAKIAPYRAQLYRTVYNRFMDESVFVANIDLVYIPDSQYKGLPPNCDLKQAVIQQAPEFFGDKRYTISLDLWNQLDNNSKAALVLHEVIYNEGIALGQDNSKSVRYLISYLTSSGFSSMSQNYLNQLLLSARFNVIDIYNTFAYSVPASENVTWFAGLNESTPFANEGMDFYKQVQLPDTFNYNGMSIRTNQFVASGNLQTLTTVDGVLSYSSKDQLTRVYPPPNANYTFSLYFENLKVVGVAATAPDPDDSMNTDNSLVLLAIDINGARAELSNRNLYSSNRHIKLFLSNNLDQTIPKSQFEGNLIMLHESSLQNGYEFIGPGSVSDDGVILSGYMKIRNTLTTAQGQLSFEPSTNMLAAPAPAPSFPGDGSGFSPPVVQKEPMSFYNNGYVKSGYLSADQTINTANGPVTVTRTAYVRFLENGLAEIIAQ